MRCRRGASFAQAFSRKAGRCSGGNERTWSKSDSSRPDSGEFEAEVLDWPLTGSIVTSIYGCVKVTIRQRTDLLASSGPCVLRGVGHEFILQFLIIRELACSLLPDGEGGVGLAGFLVEITQHEVSIGEMCLRRLVLLLLKEGVELLITSSLLFMLAGQ
jgi:hypothetical protein